MPLPKGMLLGSARAPLQNLHPPPTCEGSGTIFTLPVLILVSFSDSRNENTPAAASYYTPRTMNLLH